MIERVFEVAFANAVVNHPAVNSWVRGPIRGPLDLSSTLTNPSNVMLSGEHGIAVFAHRAPGVYEWHAAVLPEGRGKWALAAARAALDRIFAETDAIAILAPIPDHNRGARYIVHSLGFGLKQVLPSAWPIGNGEFVPLRVYVLLRREWMPCQ